MKKIVLVPFGLVSAGLVPVLEADNLDYIKGDLAKVCEIEEGGYCGEVSAVEKLNNESCRYLCEAFNKCHTKTLDDILVVENLKEIVHNFYQIKIEVVDTDTSVKKVYPYRSAISHLAWAMINGRMVEEKINDFSDVMLMVEVGIEEQSLVGTKPLIDADGLHNFVEICTYISKEGGFDKEVKPVSLASFKDRFDQGYQPSEDELKALFREKFPSVTDAVLPANETGFTIGSFLKWGLASGVGLGVVQFTGRVITKYLELMGQNSGKSWTELAKEAIKYVWKHDPTGLGWLKDKGTSLLRAIGIGGSISDVINDNASETSEGGNTPGSNETVVEDQDGGDAVRLEDNCEEEPTTNSQQKMNSGSESNEGNQTRSLKRKRVEENPVRDVPGIGSNFGANLGAVSMQKFCETMKEVVTPIVGAFSQVVNGVGKKIDTAMEKIDTTVTEFKDVKEGMRSTVIGRHIIGDGKTTETEEDDSAPWNPATDGEMELAKHYESQDREERIKELERKNEELREEQRKNKEFFEKNDRDTKKRKSILKKKVRFSDENESFSQKKESEETQEKDGRVLDEN